MVGALRNSNYCISHFTECKLKVLAHCMPGLLGDRKSIHDSDYMKLHESDYMKLHDSVYLKLKALY